MYSRRTAVLMVKLVDVRVEKPAFVRRAVHKEEEGVVHHEAKSHLGQKAKRGGRSRLQEMRGLRVKVVQGRQAPAVCPKPTGSFRRGYSESKRSSGR